MSIRTTDQASFGGGYGRGDKPAFDVMKELERLEKDIDEVRHQYELWFMGIERLEPYVDKDRVKAKIRRFRDVPMRPVQKFKFGSLRARMVSLESYWARVRRQKEEGTYYKDKNRLSRKEIERRQKEEAKRKKEMASMAEETTDGRMTVAGAAAPNEGQAVGVSEKASSAVTRGGVRKAGPSGSGKPRGRPTAKSAEDLTDNKLRQIYQTLSTAKRRCGERNDLRYEDMASSLRKQVPKLIKNTGAKAVEFKVVIKGGRAVLKAVPKHGG